MYGQDQCVRHTCVEIAQEIPFVCMVISFNNCKTISAHGYLWHPAYYSRLFNLLICSYNRPPGIFLISESHVATLSLSFLILFHLILF